MMTDEQLAKLPKWAQTEFNKMQFIINKLSEELNVYEKTTPESNTWVNIDYKTKVYLPDYARVVFKTATGAVTCHVQYDGNSEVYIDISGDGVIYPVARNVIKVIPKGRW